MLVNTVYAHELPRFRFTSSGYETLGSAIGSEKFIFQFWEKVYKNEIEPEIQSLSKFELTLDAKRVLSKNKILPKISYNSAFYDIPDVIKRKIEAKMKLFSVGSNGTGAQYEDVTHDIDHGGYDICHVTKHSELALLKPIFRLIRCKLEGSPLTVDIALTEAEVGLKMSTINKELGIRLLQNMPHHATISKQYKTALEIIQYYKITPEELVVGDIAMIYKRIQNGSTRTLYPGVQNNVFFPVPSCMTAIHHDILPNYLKSFIYRMQNCLIPLKCNYKEYGLDNDSRCEFCKLNYETNYHIFMECTHVKETWRMVEAKTGLKLYSSNIIHFKHDQTDTDFNINVYVTAVVCHKIWKMRNEIRHGDVNDFNSDFIVNAFMKSLYSRKLFEDRRGDSAYVQDFIRILQRNTT